MVANKTMSVLLVNGEGISYSLYYILEGIDLKESD